MPHRAIFLQAGLGEARLQAWIAEGWIGRDAAPAEAELARIALIQALTEELGVNEAGVDVALGLLDQLHGMRRALRQMQAELDRLPPPLRAALIEAARRGD